MTKHSFGKHARCEKCFAVRVQVKCYNGPLSKPSRTRRLIPRGLWQNIRAENISRWEKRQPGLPVLKCILQPNKHSFKHNHTERWQTRRKLDVKYVGGRLERWVEEQWGWCLSLLHIDLRILKAKSKICFLEHTLYVINVKNYQLFDSTTFLIH